MSENMQRNAEPTSFFNLKDLLYRVVFEANDMAAGDGCSIFLWDNHAGRYVLRESTVMTPFIGRYCLDPDKANSSKRTGITSICLKNGRPYLCKDVRQDSNWSHYKKLKKPSPKVMCEHCEVPANELGSLIAVPIKGRGEDIRAQEAGAKDQGPAIKGVLRVARDRNRESFSILEKKRLVEFVELRTPDILGTLTLDNILEIGPILDKSALCQGAVALLTDMVDGRGCSVFLLDEAKSDKKHQIYHCQATTGIEKGMKKLGDITDAIYGLPEDKDKYLTAYVAHEKINLVVDDIYESDFAALYSLSRVAGSGKFSEHFREGAKRVETGAFMATPLFYREKFDPETPAMGVIRVTRPRGDAPFSPNHQRWFFSIADRLSKAILHADYVALLNDLSTTYVRDEKFEKVVSKLPRLIGSKGCSVFTGKEKLQMRATSGALETELESRSIEPYVISDKHTHGYTKACLVRDEFIFYNNKDDRKKLARKGISPSGRKECETEVPPERFMAAPIRVRGVPIGVIRAPKTKDESPFSVEDKLMLKSVAGHLGRVIHTQNFRTLSQFVDRAVYETLINDPSLLEARSRWVTIAFWDIRGFSRLSETLKAHPEMIADFIGEYCNAAADVVFNHQGILDKFIGDGVMAIFGFLEDQENQDKPAADAVKAAIDLRKRFREILERWRVLWDSFIAEDVDIGLGCGIHTGEVIAGLFETKNRHQFTALGPSVNLASRIEEQADAGQILLSKTVAKRIEKQQIRAFPVDTIRNIKNIKGSYPLYSVDPVPESSARRVGGDGKGIKANYPLLSTEEAVPGSTSAKK